MPNSETGSNDRLESWKEVSAYLKREVRTVQRWEKNEGLPIHRLQHEKLGSVYAYKSELDAWWKDRKPRLEQQPEPAEAVDAPDATPSPIDSPLPRGNGFSAASRVGRGLGFIILIGLTIYAIRESQKTPPHIQAKEKVMLAVLPFQNLSGKEEDEPFSDGLTEEMITQLSRLQPERLGVIARTTAMQYKNTKKTAEEIGRELGVDYILEGSARLEGKRVRISGQLILVSDQTHLWASNYDRDLESVLVVQSEVARAIADQIQLNLSPQRQQQLANPRPVNAEAYEAYQWGRHLTYQRTPDGIKHGVEFFRKSIQADPNYAPAYAGLADVTNFAAFYSFMPPKEAYPQAVEAAKRALKLDESLGEAHASLANLQYEYEYDWQAAGKSFERAVELGPSYSTGREWYAVYLAMLGQHDKASQQIQIAQKLDPYSVAILADVALLHFYAREYDAAIEQAQKAITLDPNYALGHFWLGRALLMKGRHEEGIAALKKSTEVQPGNLLALAVLGNAYGVAGKKDEAEKIIQQLKEFQPQRYLSPAYMSLVYLGIKDHTRALEWAEKGFVEHAGLLTRLKMDPIADGLHGDPRYEKLLNKLGFPPGTNK
ncbi:MAG: tetratricopeptide repeat protein [Acidobacteria bacterium]|nr:tetratricopeptide repeat protein [Acidobacteriota bacterium]